jgi:hypothetical protein
MKLTMDIPDELWDAARKAAAREGLPLRTLVITALHRLLSERQAGGSFRLRDASFKGQGLNPAFATASWAQIRDSTYPLPGGVEPGE